MANFLIAHKALEPYEGGYANTPSDKGGETFRGIARNFFPNWPGWTKIDALKSHPEFKRIVDDSPDLRGSVGVFYKNNFWDALKLDDFASQDLANYLFDTSVNFGIRRAALFLQQSLNEIGAVIPVDGIVGPVTMDAVKALGGAKTSAELIKLKIMRFRVKHRIGIIEEDGSQLQFIHSWLCRDTEVPC